MLDCRPARRPSAASARGGTAGTEVLRRARRPSSARRSRGAALGLLAGVVAAGGAGLWLTSRHATETAQPSRPGPAPCTPLPYQPCGGPPRPSPTATRAPPCTPTTTPSPPTAARRRPTPSPTVRRSLAAWTANLVPADDVDTFAMHVVDRFQLFCDGLLRVDAHRACGHRAAPRRHRAPPAECSDRPPAPTALAPWRRCRSRRVGATTPARSPRASRPCTASARSRTGSSAPVRSESPSRAVGYVRRHEGRREQCPRHRCLIGHRRRAGS